MTTLNERIGLKKPETVPKVVIAGSANLDLYFRTERLPAPGETIVSTEIRRSFGGKGANQAVAVSKLGGRAIMVCRVGNDESGEKLLGNFVETGVDTRYVIRDPDFSSGMAFIVVDKKGENTIVIYSGANMRLRTDDLDSAIDDIKGSNVTVAQLEIPVSTVMKLAEISRDINVPFILNPAPAPKEDIFPILKKVDILCPNRNEAASLTGVKISKLKDSVVAGRKLIEAGVKNVVLTLGAEGAMLVTEDMENHFPSPRVKVINTTGAGDAFVGALAFFLGCGTAITEAISFSNLVAAFSVTREGTQTALPTFDELLEFQKGLKEPA